MIKELGIGNHIVGHQLIILNPKFIPPKNSHVFLDNNLIGYVEYPFGKVSNPMLAINLKKAVNKRDLTDFKLTVTKPKKKRSKNRRR